MATAAEPIIAADEACESDFTILDVPRDDNEEWHHPPTTQTLPAKVRTIDKALGGGFEYGGVHCLIATIEQDTRELVYGLMMSHLCSSPTNTASLIESSASFGVRELYQVLENALKDEDDPKQAALKTVARLSIMKVFDDHGLRDALQEVYDRAKETFVRENEGGEARTEKPPRSTIPDSEDEEEDLMTAPSPRQEKQPGQASLPSAKQPASGLLVIDNISQLFSARIKENYAKGHASLTAFMRMLDQVTRAFGLCTVVVSHPSKWPVDEGDSPSLLGACKIQPALGVDFAASVDVLVYIFSIPAKKATEEESKGKLPRPMVSLLEIVQDRRGGRCGRTAGFLCEPGGCIRDAL